MCFSHAESVVFSTAPWCLPLLCGKWLATVSANPACQHFLPSLWLTWSQTMWKRKKAQHRKSKLFTTIRWGLTMMEATTLTMLRTLAKSHNPWDLFAHAGCVCRGFVSNYELYGFSIKICKSKCLCENSSVCLYVCSRWSKDIINFQLLTTMMVNLALLVFLLLLSFEIDSIAGNLWKSIGYTGMR